MKSRFLARCIIVSLAGAVMAAHAQEAPPPVTGSLAITSDYLFRGLTQTNRKPALQGSLQYDHTSGFYAGVWGSSISWLSDYEGVSSSIELDLYAGFKGGFGEGWTYDVGVLRYQYPGQFPDGFTSPNTTEVYASIGWKTLSAKYWYATTNAFGFTDSEKSDYIEVNWNQPFADIWTFNAHAGHQTIDGLSDADYTDYKVGVTVTLPHAFSLAAAYSDTDAKESVYTNSYGKFLGKNTVLVTLTKTF